MGRKLLFIFFLLVTMLVKAQFIFSGHLNNKEWHNNVYLSVMDDYRKISGVYSEQIIAKIKSDSLGLSKFTNISDYPIIISNVKGSCGCVVPIYSKTSYYLADS